MIALLVRLAIMVRVLRVRLLVETIRRVTVRLELEELAAVMERNAAAAEGSGVPGSLSQARDLRRHAARIREIGGVR